MYQVLYRKWRSQTFAEIYGQPGIVAALRGEMRTGKIAHAYLFTGSRGTGKTSCAKILAKAVNCLDLRDGDPCNACDSCRGIDNGSILDVVEIDAASNNGVDNIRDLREEVNYTPVSVKYRVYIIDEVHMLSIGAFNALLKTLEEPPEHVIFVLATTEAHKLPATILSRCQRFDFNRIPPADIAARIHYIAGQENFTVENEAAALIARLADGGMRDALSLLDQCLSRAEEAEGIKQVTAAVVVDTAGLAGDDCLYELSAAVLESNGAAALEIVDKLYASSRDMERLCADLVYFYRNLMVVKSVADPGGLVVASSDEIGRLRAEAEKYPLPAILHCMDVLQRGADRLRSGASRRVEMELVMLRLCSP
ncbi:MAG: DNA polymerase III subunit gamma/tau, partial [Oscillospiraceae bacterium]|nr:DNA polymerase III subunit gamma/tau [Oscillospiraceae bacterium]